jgi:flavin-dependent dehydrogenase
VNRPDDVAVIGAGPAGTAAALLLARAGLRVTLVDKARFPRPKACGEGVMPSGVRVLERLGALGDVERAGRRFRGIRFVERSGRAAEGVFPGGESGIVVRREELDALLIERARADARIRVVEGRRAARPLFEAGRLAGFETAPAGQVRAREFLVADGALSPAAESLGVRRRLPRRRRFGLRTHFRGLEGLGASVEVFLFDGGEVYVAPQREPGTALVSVLLEQSELGRFAGRTREALEETLRARAPLAARMRRAERLTPIIGLGPFGGERERVSGPGWLLAGDAAGGVDPITGDGVALALRNAELAAETLLRRLRGESAESTGADYARARRALTRETRWRARLLLALTSGPAASRAAVAALSASPRLFSLLLSGC